MNIWVNFCFVFFFLVLICLFLFLIHFVFIIIEFIILHYQYDKEYSDMLYKHIIANKLKNLLINFHFPISSPSSI